MDTPLKYDKNILPACVGGQMPTDPNQLVIDGKIMIETVYADLCLGLLKGERIWL